ncbi:hypothetical protein NUW58_g2529 [Xylaria curta]|uniref:Uncharacterized protein n=1 Tax=Xylaria curta TaxID=42375 RepID=A0ACC1PH01_9PEZI|nr:hypothetical protein NUW58_g2529 [Xylaria curta]
MPAVPTVAHGTSTVNGQAEHNRSSSVTMSANGPNSYSTNGAPAGAKPADIKFGYQDSPSVSHSTPQPPSAPVAIPGAASRVTEPRSSPTPIPQPSASGGRPPSNAPPSATNVAFGSFDNDRTHMRTPSASQDPNALGPHSPHIRRGSNVSDISNHAGPQPGGMNRGNFGSGGSRGGRAYSSGYNNTMGYPPNNFNRSQQGNQGRSGVPTNFAGNGRQPHHFGTPPQQNRSPAMAAAMPQPIPTMPPGQMPPYYHPYPNAMDPRQQVPNQIFPSPVQQSFERTQPKQKKKGLRRESEKYSNHHRRTDALRHDGDWRPRRFSGRLDSRTSTLDELRQSGRLRVDRFDSSSASEPPIIPLFNSAMTQTMGHIDLSPESGNFDRLLTTVKQNYFPYPPGTNMQPMQPMQAYPAYQGTHAHAQGSPLTHYPQPAYVPGPYNPPGPQPMSRSNSSQISDQRPVSSTGQSQAPVAQGTPQQQAAQLKPVVAQSPFTRPTKRSAAITIKNENGEAIDLKNLKPPASPASTTQQSRTPPGRVLYSYAPP